MLGELLQSLDDPDVATRVVAALGDDNVSEQIAAASRREGRPQHEIVSSAVWGFLEVATDDHWLQLIGIMNRADDPGLAVIRAILVKVLSEDRR